MDGWDEASLGSVSSGGGSGGIVAPPPPPPTGGGYYAQRPTEGEEGEEQEQSQTQHPSYQQPAHYMSSPVGRTPAGEYDEGDRPIPPMTDPGAYRGPAAAVFTPPRAGGGEDRAGERLSSVIQQRQSELDDVRASPLLAFKNQVGQSRSATQSASKMLERANRALGADRSRQRLSSHTPPRRVTQAATVDAARQRWGEESGQQKQQQQEQQHDQGAGTTPTPRVDKLRESPMGIYSPQTTMTYSPPPSPRGPAGPAEGPGGEGRRVPPGDGAPPRGEDDGGSSDMAMTEHQHGHHEPSAAAVAAVSLPVVPSVGVEEEVTSKENARNSQIEHMQQQLQRVQEELTAAQQESNALRQDLIAFEEMRRRTEEIESQLCLVQEAKNETDVRSVELFDELTGIRGEAQRREEELTHARAETQRIHDKNMQLAEELQAAHEYVERLRREASSAAAQGGEGFDDERSTGGTPRGAGPAPSLVGDTAAAAAAAAAGGEVVGDGAAEGVLEELRAEVETARAEAVKASRAETTAKENIAILHTQMKEWKAKAQGLQQQQSSQQPQQQQQQRLTTADRGGRGGGVEEEGGGLLVGALFGLLRLVMKAVGLSGLILLGLAVLSSDVLRPRTVDYFRLTH